MSGDNRYSCTGMGFQPDYTFHIPSLDSTSGNITYSFGNFGSVKGSKLELEEGFLPFDVLAVNSVTGEIVVAPTIITAKSLSTARVALARLIPDSENLNLDDIDLYVSEVGGLVR